jgi:hypothetical protein
LANRQLDKAEQKKASDLLARIRSELNGLSGDDPNLLFAYRRKIFKRTDV